MRNFSAVSASVFVLGLILVWTKASAEATTYTVPNDFASIQDAINAAESGDTVFVEAGEYNETVQLKSGVLLLGAGRELVTIRSTPDMGPVISALNCEDAIVRGFTLKHVVADEVGRALSDLPPVFLVNNASIVIEDCEVFGGIVSGIRCELGGDSLIENCFVHDNLWNGIHIRWGARATVRNSTSTGNERSGLSFYASGTGVAEDNILTNNRNNGIRVLGFGSSPKLLRNRCDNNGRAGIYYADKAAGEATGNICEGNLKYGISVNGAETRPLLSDNTLNGNKIANLKYDKGASVTELQPKQVIEFTEDVISEMLKAGEFSELEALANRLRVEKSRFSGGAWQLHWFYKYLSLDQGMVPARVRAEFEENMTLWKEAYPDSVTWRIVQAHTLVDVAWKARGGGWASSVSEEGWVGMKKNLFASWDFLVDAHHQEMKDPEIYAAAITVVMGLGNNDSTDFDDGLIDGEGMTDILDRLVTIGTELEPTYYPIYYNRTVTLLPRWSGNEGEVERFAAVSADRTKDMDGESLYARLAWSVQAYVGPEVYVERFDFDWSRINQGHKDVLEYYPDSVWWLNNYALTACLHKDREVAATIFERTGEDWEKLIWDTKYRYERWRDWARDEGSYPIDPALRAALQFNNDALVLNLIESDRDPNWTDDAGLSVLYLVMAAESFDAARKLIELGADTSYTSPIGFSLLSITLRQDTDEGLRMLLEGGVDVDMANRMKITALYQCAHNGWHEKAKLLIEYGAEVDIALPNGQRPLHAAAAAGHTEMVALLLDEGADMNAPGLRGMTPLSWARNRGSLHVADLLEKRGAKLK